MTTTSGTGPVGRRPRRPWQTVLRRPVAVASLGYLVVALAAAVAAPLFAPYDPTATDLNHVLAGPSAGHLLGTDTLGRDVLSRLMYGGQVSLLGVAQAVVTVLAIGVPLGLLSGFLGGWLDRLISSIVDIALAIPTLVMLLVVLAIFGSNQAAAMITLGVLASPGFARVVRGATLAVRHELYVAAARVAGLPPRQIIVKHILPRVAGPIIVRTSLFAGGALLAQSGLSYLGLGVQPPTPTWGGMVAEASVVIDQQPWLLVPPGVVIGLAILAFGLVGDAVRDATADRSLRPAVRRPRRVAPAVSDGGAEASRSALLSLRGVSVELPTADGPAIVVQGLDLDIAPGETVGLVGESGCGKSMTGRAILGLLPEGGRLSTGRVVFDDIDLTTLGRRALRRLRGRQIALVSQEPIASLDPVYPVGRQLAELVRCYDRRLPRAAVRKRVHELLATVNLPNPEQVARRYPHELSGGMAQRVAIAAALAGRPRLLIADEPTTALDVTVQAEILDLLRRLQRETGMAILLVTHDWGVVADICRRTYVMYAGQAVEATTTERMFDHPKHPYTAGLLDSTPQPDHRGHRLPAIPGTVPSPGRWPDGCRFAPRCPYATAECTAAPVAFAEPQQGHLTRCLHHEQVNKGGDRDRTATAAGTA
ncbi:dipeptide/oligopeptide/nickel ABC transporter permease/ATP-binding protein [Phytohabitans kaempferiae]|uniref:Dipeptide/oligopeptide/nickel ABC transporter permease/ATP-binding protein n=1 Tax=Phytohabitans kaempferiae TaxID=1620943 RepID=A0ABV6MIN6_9ACTN